MALATDALRIAQLEIGKPYSISGCRCLPDCYARDCSGLIVYAVNMLGLGFPCTSSFAIADVCAKRGTTISEQQAIHTPGAIGIENPFGTPNGIGSNGHIVFFDGNGVTTTEAMGHQNGICHGAATGRGFSMWAHFPGLDYGSPAPPPVARPPKGIIVDYTHTRATTMDVAYKAPGYFESSWNTGVNLAECWATLHGPKYDIDGPWPWLLGASVRVQLREGTRVLVSITAPNWKDGNPLPRAHVFGIPT